MNLNNKNISIILIIFLIVVLLIKNIKDNYKKIELTEGFKTNLLAKYGLDKDKMFISQENPIIFDIHKSFDNSFIKNYDFLHVNTNTLIPFFKDKLNEKSNRLVKRNILIYPIQIILLPINPSDKNLDVDLHKKKEFNYLFLALFSNGGLYTKLNLEDRFWNGPIKNSIIKLNDEYKPIRNISMDKDGYLIGLDYEGFLYKKPYDNLELEHKYYYQNEWKLVTSNLPMKYIMNKENDEYYFISKKDNILGLCNYDGNTVNYSQKTFNLTNNLKIERMCKDTKDHFLFIDENFKLYKSEESETDILKKNINNINIDTNSFNPSKLIDVIYDFDMKLHGLVLTNMNSIELTKQEIGSYLGIFKEKKNEDNKKILLTNNQIINFKNNINIINKEEYETLEDSFFEQKKDDYTEFKNFCKDRFGNNFIDASFLNKKEKNDKIIKELKNIKDELLRINQYDTKKK